MAREWQQRFEDQQLRVETARNDAMFIRTEREISQAQLRQRAFKEQGREALAAQRAAQASPREYPPTSLFAHPPNFRMN